MVSPKYLWLFAPLALFLATSAFAAGDAAKGKQVFMANCMACHNIDPAKDGAIGPAIKGTSTALLEKRLLAGAYPAGYKPKRDTKMMPPMPHLKGSIPDLAAFLK